MGSFVLAEWKPTWYGNAKPEARLEFRNWLKQTLVAERMNITFKKADGSIRHMHCTLHADLLPEATAETTSNRKENIDTLSVWDIDKQAWRSFKLENVTDFSYNLGALHV
jgi:hypothetical protein